MKYEAIVIGASAGGFNAYTQIISALPPDFPLPLMLVQHCMESENSYLATHLNNHCKLEVVEVTDKQKIEPGYVYVCPPGYHLLIESKHHMALSLEPPLNYSRPSIDLLFESAANVYHDKLICILLTGASNDGTSGMKYVHELGGLCVVQDPRTADAQTMPQSAINCIPVNYILPLSDIGNWIAALGDNNGVT